MYLSCLRIKNLVALFFIVCVGSSCNPENAQTKKLSLESSYSPESPAQIPLVKYYSEFSKNDLFAVWVSDCQEISLEDIGEVEARSGYKFKNTPGLRVQWDIVKLFGFQETLRTTYSYYDDLNSCISSQSKNYGSLYPPRYTHGDSQSITFNNFDNRLGGWRIQMPNTSGDYDFDVLSIREGILYFGDSEGKLDQDGYPTELLDSMPAHLVSKNN